MRWVIGVLILISAGVVLFAIAIPPSENKTFGACLVVVGVLNILLHRTIGRNFYRQTQSAPFGRDFWKGIGNEGVQFLYLGIGIILGSVGSFLVIRAL